MWAPRVWRGSWLRRLSRGAESAHAPLLVALGGGAAQRQYALFPSAGPTEQAQTPRS